MKEFFVIKKENKGSLSYFGNLNGDLIQKFTVLLPYAKWYQTYQEALTVLNEVAGYDLEAIYSIEKYFICINQ